MGLRAQNNQALKVPSNEYILGYLFKDKKYFVLTLTKRSSIFNLYEVSLNSNTKSSIDMSSVDIRPFKNISDLLKDEGFEASYIDRSLPNSLFDVHDECRIQVISAKLVFDLFYVRIPVQVIESYIFS